MDMAKQWCTLLNVLQKDKGYNQLVLNAQVQAQGFYEKLGYIQTGPVFIEENIDHIKMYKNI